MESWLDLVVKVLELLFLGGGLYAIVTISDKKAAATLENISKIGETYTALQDQMRENYNSLLEQKDKYIASQQDEINILKDDVTKKDKFLNEYQEQINQMHQTDNVHIQQIGQLKIMQMRRCDVFNCPNRKPPLDLGLIVDKDIENRDWSNLQDISGYTQDVLTKKFAEQRVNGLLHRTDIKINMNDEEDNK